MHRRCSRCVARCIAVRYSRPSSCGSLCCNAVTVVATLAGILVAFVAVALCIASPLQLLHHRCSRHSSYGCSRRCSRCTAQFHSSCSRCFVRCTTVLRVAVVVADATAVVASCVHRLCRRCNTVAVAFAVVASRVATAVAASCVHPTVAGVASPLRLRLQS